MAAQKPRSRKAGGPGGRKAPGGSRRPSGVAPARGRFFRFLAVAALVAFVVGFAYAYHRPLKAPRARGTPAASTASVMLETATPVPPAAISPGEVQPAGTRRRAQVAQKHREEGVALKPNPVAALRPPATPTTPGLRPTTPPVPAATPALCKAAIIVDDCGASLEAIRPFLDSPAPVTLAVLPYLPFSQLIARESSSHGKAVMLHFPMQTITGRDPGQGTLRVDMTDEQMVDVIRRNLAAVPHIEGVNNHEGSKATADPRAMQILMKAIKERGLYFVDSFTTLDSCAFAQASRQALPCARRDVFLDNEDNIDAIKEQMRQLMREAQEHGTAIGIGHARHTTAVAFVEMLPAFQEAGVRLVFARELARTGSASPPNPAEGRREKQR